jgi:hypothetical protein
MLETITNGSCIDINHTKMGAQFGMPRINEIEKLLKSYEMCQRRAVTKSLLVFFVR